MEIKILLCCLFERDRLCRSECLPRAFGLSRVQWIDTVSQKRPGQLSAATCCVEIDRMQRSKPHPSLTAGAFEAKHPRAIVWALDLQIETVGVEIASGIAQLDDPLLGQLQSPDYSPAWFAGAYRAASGLMGAKAIMKCRSFNRFYSFAARFSGCLRGSSRMLNVVSPAAWGPEGRQNSC